MTTKFSPVQIQIFVAMLTDVLAPYGYQIVPMGDGAETVPVSEIQSKPKPKIKGLKSVKAFVQK